MKGSITLDKRIRIRSDVVSRDLDGEVVILNLTTGFYFGLDPVGTVVWQALVGDPALSAALAALLAEYDVSPERGERDLLRLVAALRENELVDVERGATG
jgi:Coenzyme PQQ synthesis protein D (PqqD)